MLEGLNGDNMSCPNSGSCEVRFESWATKLARVLPFDRRESWVDSMGCWAQ
jgi:hypothetical protein